MSHSYSQNIVHVVFSTKGRAECILEDFQSRFWAYMAGICQKQGAHVYIVGGMPDHIHILLVMPPTIPLSKFIATIKANSSKWANEKGHKFAWQEGYAAFSVSASNVPAVVRYIERQAVHHNKMNFANEFIALLKKHGVPYDPKFVLG